jgi:hypothetical protein
VPFLAAKTFHLRDGHPFNAELCKRFLNLFELERFNDGFQFFHVAATSGSRGAFQSKANRSTRSHSNCLTRMQSRIFEFPPAVLSGAERSRKIPWNCRLILQRDFSISLEMTAQMPRKFAKNP